MMRKPFKLAYDMSNQYSHFPPLMSSHSQQAICPACKRTVDPQEEKELRKTKDMLLTYAHCVECSCSILFFHIERESLSTSIGMVTDLQRVEIDRFWNTKEVTENDVLALHELIQQPIELKKLLQQN